MSSRSTSKVSGRYRASESQGMKITNQAVASKLSAYLHHRIALSKLVDWAENAIMDGEFGGNNSHALAQVVGRIGLADVRAFGLTWEDCTAILKELGYAAHVDVVAANQHKLGSSYWRAKAEKYEAEGGVTTAKAAMNKQGKSNHTQRPKRVNSRRTTA